MRSIFCILILFATLNGFGQSTTEENILKLSSKVFKWELESKMDSLEKVFDERFVVVNAAGESQTKKQYISNLKSGNFVHDSIEIEDNSALVADNTATVIGKGTFTVTHSGKNAKIRLSYIEVFTRPNRNAPWKVLAMHATLLPNK